MTFDRITVDPPIMGGQPVVRGMRFPVKTVVRMVAGGLSPARIVAEHPDLELADVQQALEFAAGVLDADTYLPLRKSA